MTRETTFLVRHAITLVLSLLGALIIYLPANSFAEDQDSIPSNAELWEIIQKQQVEIQELRRKLTMMGTEVEATGEMMEQVAEQSGRPPMWADKTSIGGYGELHYNNLDNQKLGGADIDEVDFHRFVVYFGHEFNERVRFFSELEIEHSLVKDTATGSNSGEVELEQAYVDIDLNDEGTHVLRGGLFLIPIGILNETHEPPTFYGVERNNIEKNIIPATWWEGGLGVNGELAPGLSYDLALTSGLAVKSDYKIRGGRQKVGKASAEDPAYTGRLKWIRPGLEVAASVQFQEDLTQEKDNGAIEESEGLLYETHITLSKGRFGLRALYARWDLEAHQAEVLGADKQEGWYVEPSLRLNDRIGVFARFSEWDNEAGSSKDTSFEQFDVGINWWPQESVVFKFDYQDQHAPAGEDEFDGFNLGFGYNF